MTEKLKKLTVKRGKSFTLPLFLPVYQPRTKEFWIKSWQGDPPIEGCIVNSYFLYKNRELKSKFNQGLTLGEFLNFNGLLTTDSGAFQGFTRKLYLSNKKIIQFQDMIKTDIAAPLDLVTPPGDNRTKAEKKLNSTQKRIKQGLELVQNSILMGVQQGGRFLDLRKKSAEGLVEMGVEYIAVGSLVPFFNRNHDLSFVKNVIEDIRNIAGLDIPMHVYGAGDPLEIPFMVKFGADIFDSSSYGHYAKDGWYMTPYGAIKDPGPIISGEFSCECPLCNQHDIAEIFKRTEYLVIHNLWTICQTFYKLQKILVEGTLDETLKHILDVHTKWFPKSALKSSLGY